MPPRANTSGTTPKAVQQQHHDVADSRSKTGKLSLPAFLKLLTSGGVGLTTQDALACASALIKAGFNTAVANPFVGVSEISLVAAGVTDPDVRKDLVAFGRSGKGKTVIVDSGGNYRKRKGRDGDLDAPLPDKPAAKEAMSLDFQEETEDYLLKDRSLQINRAPVMTAWATVVAEKLGFTRQEALSIAHTYTNMNATAKGVSLGIYSPEKGKQRTDVGPSQPYVDLMGRQVPVLALQTGEWRGIAGGAIAEPEQAFGYIFRSFRQHMAAAMGALKLLADSFAPDKLNEIGYQLYAEFRPEVKGWGEKGKLDLGTVLELRPKPGQADVTGVKAEAGDVQPGTEGGLASSANEDGEGSRAIKTEMSEPSAIQRESSVPEDDPPSKRVKTDTSSTAVKTEEDEFEDEGISDADLLALA